MYCPKCGISVGDIGHFCARCGKNIAYLREPEEAEDIEANPPLEEQTEGGAQGGDNSKNAEVKAPIGKTYYCNYCGTAVNDGDNYCYSCGKQAQKKYYNGKSGDNKKKYLKLFLALLFITVLIGTYMLLAAPLHN